MIARRRPWTIPAPLVPKNSGRLLIDKGPARAAQHLAKVRLVACLVCKPGTQESRTDPHHCKIIVPSGSLKPTDYFVTPLCRHHHTYGPDALHNRGDEAAWWDEHRIDPRDFIRSFSPEGRDALRETET